MYTNWANHYLERVKSKKRVTDLQNDCRDGLLLADVVEGVTSVKVTDLIRKPKTQQQMVSHNPFSIIHRTQPTTQVDLHDETRNPHR